MQKLFSAFPDGWPGLGLLILRIALAFSGVDQAFRTVTASSLESLAACSLALFAGLTGIALLTGFFTPIAGAFASLNYLVIGIALFVSTGAISQSDAASTLDRFVMSLALVLLGPGAFSLDARLFGRREIIIPDGGRSRH